MVSRSRPAPYVAMAPRARAKLDRLTREEARHFTDKAKRQLDNLYEVLDALQRRKAHLALGYPTWSAYVQAELGITARRSYQLLMQGRVAAKLDRAMGTTGTHVSDHAAREVSGSEGAIVALAQGYLEDGYELAAALEQAVVDIRRQRREDAKAKRERKAEVAARLDAAATAGPLATVPDELVEAAVIPTIQVPLMPVDSYAFKATIRPRVISREIQAMTVGMPDRDELRDVLERIERLSGKGLELALRIAARRAPFPMLDTIHREARLRHEEAAAKRA